MDRVYIIPTDDKPVKVVYENNSCDNKIEVDNLTEELFVERPLSHSERESLLKLINDVKAINVGAYTLLKSIG